MASRQIEAIRGEKCSSTATCVARSAPGGLESNCAPDGVRAAMYQRKHSARIRLTAPSSICRGERSILTQLVSIALPPATSHRSGADAVSGYLADALGRRAPMKIIAAILA